MTATRFRGIDVGTLVTEPIRKHPMSLAQPFVTLDHISRGHAIMGIGNGERENVEPYGLPWEKQVARLEEAMGPDGEGCRLRRHPSPTRGERTALALVDPDRLPFDPDHVEPLGYLDAYRTGTGFRIFPVVSLVREGFTLKLDAREVADAFEVPLAFLMAEENHRLHSREWKGMTRTVYAMPFGERYIWGVTAGILRNLYERIYR